MKLKLEDNNMGNYTRDKLELNSKANDAGIMAGASILVGLAVLLVKTFNDCSRDNRSRDDCNRDDQIR